MSSCLSTHAGKELTMKLTNHMSDLPERMQYESQEEYAPWREQA